MNLPFLTANPALAIAWAFVKRFWYLPIILALVFFVLIERQHATKLAADNAAQAAEVKNLAAAAKVNNDALATATKLRADNDKLMLSLLEVEKLNGQRSTLATTTIQEVIRNDPKTRDWANIALPAGVRNALNAPAPH